MPINQRAGARIELYGQQAEAQLEYARQVADVKHQLTDAALQHGFHLYSQFMQKHQDNNARNVSGQ